MGEDEALKKFTFEVGELHRLARSRTSMNPKHRGKGDSEPEVAERYTRLWGGVGRCPTAGMNPQAGLLSLLSRGAYVNNEATWWVSGPCIGKGAFLGSGSTYRPWRSSSVDCFITWDCPRLCHK